MFRRPLIKAISISSDGGVVCPVLLFSLVELTAVSLSEGVLKAGIFLGVASLGENYDLIARVNLCHRTRLVKNGLGTLFGLKSPGAPGTPMRCAGGKLKCDECKAKFEMRHAHGLSHCAAILQETDIGLRREMVGHKVRNGCAKDGKSKLTSCIFRGMAMRRGASCRRPPYF